MSQDELAKKIGYKTRSSVNKVEQGLIDIPQSKIKMFADALGVTPEYLMGWASSENFAANDEERRLLKGYRALNNESKRLISDLIRQQIRQNISKSQKRRRQTLLKGIS